MASETLMSKDKEFYQLNMQLEERIRSLMVDVESIITRSGNFSNFQNQVQKKANFSHSKMRPGNLSLGSKEHAFLFGKQMNKLNGCKTAKITELEDSSDGNVSGGSCDGNVGKSGKNRNGKKRSANETIIRFLKAQVAKLQAEIQTAQYEIKKRGERCKDLELELKKQEEKRDKLQNQLSQQKELTNKNETSNAELQTKIHTQNSEISSLKKEIENLKKEVKSLQQQCCNGELRLNRSHEESERLRNSLKNCQTEERELRDQMRKLQEEKLCFVKIADKQRTELLQAFKKQCELVENLRKQVTHLERGKAVQFLEEDFLRLLEWNPDEK